MSRQSKASLLERFAHLAAGHDVALSPEGQDTLRGELDVSLGRWMIGGHSINYRCWCRLDETARTVTFRESTTETSWGIPPPTVKIERRTQAGTRVSEATATSAPDGSGRLDYGALRERFAEATREAGWNFNYEAGKWP
jgi:hypothetical protein